MKEPLFLTVQQVTNLHKRSIELFGGTHGLRDLAGLESATHQPQNVYDYSPGDLYSIAAAYAFHIGESQACLDGNKRTAAAAALNFLRVNGEETVYDGSILYSLLIGIAERTSSQSDLASYLQKAAGREDI